MRPVEARGVIPPDQADIDQVNSLRGSIRQPSKLVRGAGFALGFGSSALTLAACARPDQAQIQAAVQTAVEATQIARATTVPEPQRSPEVQQVNRPTIEVYMQEFKEGVGPGPNKVPAMAEGLDGRQKHLTSDFFLPDTYYTIEGNQKIIYLHVIFNREGSKMLGEIVEREREITKKYGGIGMYMSGIDYPNELNYGIGNLSSWISQRSTGELELRYQFGSDKGGGEVEKAASLVGRLNQEAQARALQRGETTAPARVEPTSARLQEAQATSVARTAIEGLINQNPQPFIQAIAPGSNIQIGPSEMVMMQSCRGVPVNYTEEQLQGQENKRLVKVDFGQACIAASRPGATPLNALYLSLENRGGSWLLTGVNLGPTQQVQEAQRSQNQAGEIPSGWKLHVSQSFPYQIYYPPNWWTGGLSNIGEEFYGRKAENLNLGTAAMRITVVTGPDWMTLENHVQNRMNSLPGYAQNLQRIKENLISIDGIKPEVITYSYPQGGYLVGDLISFTGLATSNKNISVGEAFLSKNNQIWHFQSAYDFAAIETGDDLSDMLKTFKILR